MIETTIGGLLMVKPIIQQIAATPLPIKESYRILKLLKAIDAEYTMIEQTSDSCVKKYAVLNEDGTPKVDKDNRVVVEEDKIKQFNDEWETFLQSKIFLDNNPIGSEILEKIDISISPTQLMFLDPFIE